MSRARPKVRTEIRLDRGLHKWMENNRRLRGWSRTDFMELALRELRKHGLPQTLNDEVTDDEAQPR